MRKRYKNADEGVVLAVIQIAEDPIQCRTDGTSAFNTHTARGRLLLLDLARGEEKLRESSGSMTAWWWSLQFSGRASPSTTEEEVELERGRAAPGEGCGCPPTPSLYIGGREEEEAPYGRGGGHRGNPRWVWAPPPLGNLPPSREGWLP